MRVLVVNAGSSSIKYQLIDMDTEIAIAKGTCERIGLKGSNLKHTTKDGEVIIEKEMPTHSVAVKLMLDALVDKEHGCISSMKEIGAVGHRVVHSAEDYDESVLITDEVIKVCERNSELAPLHMPANITGIKACKEVMGKTPMVGVFDTAFHATMPDYAYMYALPYEAYQNYKIRRYGFHGTSHKYVANEAANYLNKDIKSLKIITCHLGNGSSITAVKGGISIDTSMGFTPLEGLPMGTRSGDIDPAIIEFLTEKTGMSLAKVLEYLNKKSGVQGISGVSSDFRDLDNASDSGNYRAKLALDVFNYKCKKFIGSYVAAMGGVDAVVFAGGIGENNVRVRAEVIKGLECLGIKMDYIKNDTKNIGAIRDVSAEDSRVKVLIIPTNEELVIARETVELVK